MILVVAKICHLKDDSMPTHLFVRCDISYLTFRRINTYVTRIGVRAFSIRRGHLIILLEALGGLAWACLLSCPTHTPHPRPDLSPRPRALQLLLLQLQLGR